MLDQEFFRKSMVHKLRPNRSMPLSYNVLTTKRGGIYCLSMYCPFQNYIFKICIVTMETGIFDRSNIELHQPELYGVMQFICRFAQSGVALCGFMTPIELFTFYFSRKQFGGNMGLLGTCISV
jgi:hypothetical protein